MMRTNYCLHCGRKDAGPVCKRCIDNARSFVYQIENLQTSISDTIASRGFYSCNSFVERYNQILQNAKRSFAADDCISKLTDILPERRPEEIPPPYTDGYLIAKMKEVELYAGQLASCMRNIIGPQSQISVAMMNILSNSVNISGSTIDAVYASGSSFSSFQSAYSEAKRLMNVIEASGAQPSYLGRMETVINEMGRLYDESEKKWIQGVLQDNREMILESADNLDNRLKELEEKVDDVRSLFKKNQELTEKIYNLFNVKDALPEETQLFKNLGHDQLLKSIKRWLEDKKTEIAGPYSITIHSRHESGIDILTEISQSKIGIQVHSYDDIRGEKEAFGSKVTRQIGQSFKYTLSGRIIIYCGDMTDISQKDKILKSISEISQMKDISIKSVPPQKAVVIIKEKMKAAADGD